MSLSRLGDAALYGSPRRGAQPGGKARGVDGRHRLSGVPLFSRRPEICHLDAFVGGHAGRSPHQVGEAFQVTARRRAQRVGVTAPVRPGTPYECRQTGGLVLGGVHPSASERLDGLMEAPSAFRRLGQRVEQLAP
jgi:hypothetical protein